MLAAQRLDDNPCRPRHFKPPPPCAPVVGDERANQLLETCRTRLLAAAALFAVVFLVVVLRLAEIENSRRSAAFGRQPCFSSNPKRKKKSTCRHRQSLTACTSGMGSMCSRMRSWRNFAGGEPNSRLNARLKAASDS